MKSVTASFLLLAFLTGRALGQIPTSDVNPGGPNNTTNIDRTSTKSIIGVSTPHVNLTSTDSMSGTPTSPVVTQTSSIVNPSSSTTGLGGSGSGSGVAQTGTGTSSGAQSSPTGSNAASAYHVEFAGTITGLLALLVAALL